MLDRKSGPENEWDGIMKTMGIDPGLSGAIVTLEGGEIEKFVMPTVGNLLELDELNRIFLSLKNSVYHAFLEKVSAMPKQGSSSMFKFGRVYGIAEAFLVSHQIPYTLVTPQRWQRSMHAGVEKNLDPKQRSRVAASRLFPGLDLLANKKCRVPHSGIIDALLIAEYGRRQITQQDLG